MRVTEPIRWTPEGVVMLDQRRLPGEVIYHTYTDYRDVARAILDMEIRGAPAIGVAAAMGMAIGVERSPAATLEDLRAEFEVICDVFSKTRPTAVDLFWAIARMRRAFDAACESATGTGSPGRVLDDVRGAMVREAHLVHQEKKEHDEAIGRHGAPL